MNGRDLQYQRRIRRHSRAEVRRQIKMWRWLIRMIGRHWRRERRRYIAEAMR